MSAAVQHRTDSASIGSIQYYNRLPQWQRRDTLLFTPPILVASYYAYLVDASVESFVTGVSAVDLAKFLLGVLTVLQGLATVSCYWTVAAECLSHAIKLICLKPQSVAIFTSSSVKSPSGPINTSTGCAF